MSKPPHTVAIIDRDPRIICAAANVLSALGLRRELYHSIEAFFADPRASLIGCLIVDLKIAHAGSVDLPRRLAESGRGSQIIFTGERAARLDFRQLMQAGCFAFVRKPLLTSKLADALIRWLQLARQEAPVMTHR